MVDTAANCHTNLVIGGATNSFTIKLVDSTSTNPLNENAAANGLIAFDSANDPITGSTFAVSIHTTVGLLNVLRDVLTTHGVGGLNRRLNLTPGQLGQFLDRYISSSRSLGVMRVSGGSGPSPGTALTLMLLDADNNLSFPCDAPCFNGG